MASLTSLLASEASLLHEAAAALPHSFDKCTHAMGPLRQAVHLCLTCAAPRGLCSACSVACHGDHEQIELFPKRGFVCDCPTRVGGTNCTLNAGAVEAENTGNKYGQNFKARFCRCGGEYDPKRERETMVQCLACEDWFHESCLNLRTRPVERQASPGPTATVPTVDDDIEVDSTASNDLPPPLLPSSSYETLICGACVLANETLRKWAGTKGIMMVMKRGGTDITAHIEDGGVDPRWKVFDGSEDETAAELDIISEVQEGKRPLANDGSQITDEERPTKKLRANDGSEIPVGQPGEHPILEADVPPACLAPPPNALAQRVLKALTVRQDNGESQISGDAEIELGEGDIFLTEGWRERWCRCPKCVSALEPHPYLLKEEETYEPPEDPDSATSLEELGMRALQNLPRDRAIDGIRAYNAMRDELMTYLRPFAQEGRVVREEDVREFFDQRAQQRAEGDTVR